MEFRVESREEREASGLRWGAFPSRAGAKAQVEGAFGDGERGTYLEARGDIYWPPQKKSEELGSCTNAPDMLSR
jgi:hypothetical protein